MVSEVLASEEMNDLVPILIKALVEQATNKSWILAVVVVGGDC